jgi:hypothetical protein
VAPESRLSIHADGISGLESTSFGIRVTSPTPIVAERTMYWGGGFFDYYGSHVSSGATRPGSQWVVAEGGHGGENGAETYVLVANVSDAPVSVSFRPLLNGGPRSVSTHVVPARSRLTLSGTALIGPAESGPRVFGMEVFESEFPRGVLVVEASLYWNAEGVFWAAGAGWPATRIQ